jgi:hypothetical protein
MPSPRDPDIRVARNISLTLEVEAILRSMFGGFGQVVVEAEFGRGLDGKRAESI